MNPFRVFISYSWDSSEHRNWVKKLADALEIFEEIHVTWDGYDLDSLVDKNFFMEDGIRNADLILVVATTKYKDKANKRSGGVGIETYLNSAVHWDAMLREKRSRLLVLLREPDSTPNYLLGHFYLDFVDDSAFGQRVNELINMIKGASTIERPKKRRSLLSMEPSYEFTQVEELIRIKNPNRKALVSVADGTDFSGANRIKYELWETRSPAINYYLALHPNANIQQTAQRAAARLVDLRLSSVDVTVLRPRPRRPDQDLIAKTFSEKGLSTKIFECTYKEYIWDYCIDNVLKDIDPPSVIENYTNQTLKQSSVDADEPTDAESALDYLTDALEKPSNVAAHLVVAPGGMGKTSLCLGVAKKLHNRSDLRSSVVLIQAEAIKRYIAERGGPGQSRIESIYDIYELYAKYQDHSRLFERTTFDLAVVCGNLTIIIDGLDELNSLFQEKFDIKSFLSSLKQLHDQMGSSSILLTTRSNVVSQDTNLEALSIAQYELLGFDERSCLRYVTKRLQNYKNSEALIKKLMSQITKVRLQENDRVVPFFADIATTVLEDELKDEKGNGFEVSNEVAPYPSNNDLTDHIIHSVFRREETRHQLEIPVVDVVDFVTSLVADYGKRWPIAEARNRTTLIYDKRAEAIFSKIALNPLLKIQGDSVELRYSFLASYFEVLFMLSKVLNVSLETESARSLSRLGAESEEARELRRYFGSHAQEATTAIESLIPKLRDRALSPSTSGTSTLDRENAKGAIATLLLFYAGVQKKSADELTVKILEMYGVPTTPAETRVVNGLFVRDNFPSVDFSNLTITNSRFHRYGNLLKSRFSNTKFISCVFDTCANSGVSGFTLTADMIDSTCDLGDLTETFQLAKAGKESENAMVKAAATRFLHCFFKGDRFIEVKSDHIRFSTKVPGLAKDRFNRLVAEGYIRLAKSKAVADFYEVAPDFGQSVRNFLVNGYLDTRMKKFTKFIR